MNKISVKFQAAYMEEPVMMKDSDIFHHVDTKYLKVSAELRDAIQAWDDEYQNTLDQNYPPDSAFPSLEADIAHNEKGRLLARALQEELGEGYLVNFKERSPRG